MVKKKMYPRYFLIVTIAVYLIFYIIPSILGLVYSFTDKTIYSGSNIHFVGLRNYIQLIKQNRFMTGMKNTFSFTLITTVMKNVLGFGMAIALNQKLKTKRFGDFDFRLDAVLTDPAAGNERLPLLKYTSRHIYHSNYRDQSSPNYADKFIVDYPLGYRRGPDAKDLWFTVD